MLIFLVPALACVVLLALSWHPKAALFAVVGAGLQFVGHFGSIAWIVGLLFEVGAALFLAIRMKVT